MTSGPTTYVVLFSIAVINGTGSEFLREVQVRTLPWEICDADNPNLSDIKICAGRVAGGVDSCQVGAFLFSTAYSFFY